MTEPITAASKQDAAVVEEDTTATEQWSEECDSLLAEVLETQTEIATLLKGTNTDDLDSLKKHCDEQLVELQEDAWKLQMFVELQRMGQQLECLASLEDTSTGTGGVKEEPNADKPATESKSPRVLNCCHTCLDIDEHQAGLQDLDREIAELDKELLAARAELHELLQDKVTLQNEVTLVGEQLEALAVEA